ncbi:MAG: LamG-like jellyroll fold domain-containing protein [Casimicrobium sp.]
MLGTCTAVNRNLGSPLGAWFRLIAVASTTTGTSIYHNKQLIYTCPSAVPNFTGMNGQDLYIGRYSSVWYPLDGAAQDIRIYQQALTAAQVLALP